MTQDTQRVPYGEEETARIDGPGSPLIYLSTDAEYICHDCGVVHGELHERGCDVEQCPECKQQLIACDHDV